MLITKLHPERTMGTPSRTKKKGTMGPACPLLDCKM